MSLNKFNRLLNLHFYNRIYMHKNSYAPTFKKCPYISTHFMSSVSDSSSTPGETMSSSLLKNRIVLVTGGGSGIGKAVCQLSAREGAKVIVSDKDETSAKSTLQSLAGNDHFACAVDVADSTSVTNLFTEVQKKFSKCPSIVVNCAGITKDSFMVDMTEQMFDDVIKVNLKGTFLVSQAAGKFMIQEKITNGSIVNVSSVVGKVGNMGQCNYAASKAGVEGLTKSIAKEMAQYGIRCNAVMPGFIDTPMVQAVPEKVLDKVRAQIPMKRTGKPEEVADACVFLASDCSSYITGSIIQVSGGLFI